ncbi:hypothetical protein C1H46_035840 [Malus baccata]|uniref:Large ribosomal subunit protein uL4m n=1 Tax=Malus baccata TaxID=106549 RepID=A0A540KX57_MALBA|nr:hypothetical protein C1H46_035840 [Malus baccata]
MNLNPNADTHDTSTTHQFRQLPQLPPSNNHHDYQNPHNTSGGSSFLLHNPAAAAASYFMDNNNNDGVGGSSSFSPSTVKAKIMAHPHYHRLLASYINCQKIKRENLVDMRLEGIDTSCFPPRFFGKFGSEYLNIHVLIVIMKVGAPPEVVARLEEACASAATVGQMVSSSSESGSLGEDPALDQFMEAYCEMLTKYEQEISKPFKEAMIFLQRIESQFKALTLSCSSDSAGYGDGIDRNHVSSEEEVDVNNNFIDPQAEDRELKGQLLRKYSGYLGSLKQEFMKKRKKGKLPKEARQQLLDWWSRHYKWPYPSESQKLALAESTGLDQKQINNWFINQRKRHWKPSEDMQFVVMDASHQGHYYMDKPELAPATFLSLSHSSHSAAPSGWRIDGRKSPIAFRIGRLLRSFGSVLTSGRCDFPSNLYPSSFRASLDFCGHVPGDILLSGELSTVSKAGSFFLANRSLSTSNPTPESSGGAFPSNLLSAKPVVASDRSIGLGQDLVIPVTNFHYEDKGFTVLAGDVFDVPIRKDIIHRVVLWQLAKRQQLLVFEDFEVPTHKTKNIVNYVQQMEGSKKFLLVDGTKTEDGKQMLPEKLKLATQNLHYVNVLPAVGLNVYSILQHDTLVMTQAAVNEIVERMHTPINR